MAFTCCCAHRLSVIETSGKKVWIKIDRQTWNPGVPSTKPNVILRCWKPVGRATEEMIGERKKGS